MKLSLICVDGPLHGQVRDVEIGPGGDIVPLVVEGVTYGGFGSQLPVGAKLIYLAAGDHAADIHVIADALVTALGLDGR